MDGEYTVSCALTIDEAADCLRVPRQHLYNLITAGEGPPLARLGLRTIIESDALLEWLESRAEAAQSQLYG